MSKTKAVVLGRPERIILKQLEHGLININAIIFIPSNHCTAKKRTETNICIYL